MSLSERTMAHHAILKEIKVKANLRESDLELYKEDGQIKVILYVDRQDVHKLAGLLNPIHLELIGKADAPKKDLRVCDFQYTHLPYKGKTLHLKVSYGVALEVIG